MDKQETEKKIDKIIDLLATDILDNALCIASTSVRQEIHALAELISAKNSARAQEILEKIV